MHMKDPNNKPPWLALLFEYNGGNFNHPLVAIVHKISSVFLNSV